MTKGRDTRAVAFAAIMACGLFVSLAAAIVAHWIIKEDFTDYIQPFLSWLPDNLPLCLVLAAAFSAALGVGFFFLFTRFDRIHAALSRFEPPKLIALRFNRADVLKAALVMFVLWLPIIIIMYPTGLTADTFNQLYQYQTSAPMIYPTTGEMVNAEFIDHHPVFDTLLYGFFWSVGATLGSQNAGIFALGVLQCVILALELGTLTCYLERLEVPYAFRLVTLVFFAWFPFFGHYAVTVLKDTTYLTVFVPWMLMWMETARTRGKTLSNMRFLVVFMLLGGACIITKKMGVFVLVACLIVLAARIRPYRGRILVASATTLVVFCLALPAVVYPAIGGVAPGGKQEVLGPAIQHVTALACEDEDALSDDEKAICNRVFDLERAMDLFSAFRTDGAKSTYLSSATSDDIMQFLQVWVAQGLKHPATYLVSTFETSGMLYVPFMKITYYSGDSMWSRAEVYRETNPEFNVDVGQPDELVELNDYLEFESLESKMSDLPLISLIFTEGFYGGWIPFIAIVAVLFARRRTSSRNADAPYYLTALAPIAFTVLFLLVSPVASPRYILPMMFTTPLLLGWAWFALKGARSSETRTATTPLAT